MRIAAIVLFLFAAVLGVLSVEAAVATKPDRFQGQLHQIDQINGVTMLTIIDAVKTIVLTCNAETKVNRDGDKTDLKLDDLQVGQQLRVYYTGNLALQIHITKTE